MTQGTGPVGAGGFLAVLLGIAVASGAANRSDAGTDDDPRFRKGVNYSLNGPIADQPDGPGAGHAIICGLRDAASFLSLRAAPGTDAQEIIKLNAYTIVDLTGQFSADGAWAQLSQFIIAADAKGREWPEISQTPIPVPGWVAVDYLCDFTDHPAEGD